jgi:hypothetical protein
MLCNAAYAGYVSGLRDKSRAIKGLHEAIVTDEPFDRVQEVREWRTRVVKPGPPSDEYLLRKLLCCERCGARMNGTRGSKTAYMCSTRRYGNPCGKQIVKASGPCGDAITRRARPPINAERTTFASATTAGGGEIVQDLRLADPLAG